MPIRRYPLMRIFALWLIALCGAAAAWGAEKMIPSSSVDVSKPRFFVVGIGLNRYQDSFWTPLKWAARDVQRVSAALGQDTGYTVERRLLFDADATLSRIKQSLRTLQTQVRAQDVVVLYISSHGTLGFDRDGFFKKYVVVHDTVQKQLADTGLAHRYLRDWMEALPALRKLMIFASCHSGIGKSRLPPEVAALLAQQKGALPPLDDVSEGFLILSAAAEREAALESDELGGDVYTHFFLQGLESYDRNQDGMITALEAHDFAQVKAWEYTRGRQRATVEAQLIGKADLPLRGRSKRLGLPILEAYNTMLKGFSLKVNAGTKGSLPMAFPLEQSNNRVHLYGPEGKEPLGVYELSASPGQVIRLEDLTAPEPWEIFVEAGTSTWQDEAFQRLTGERQFTTWSIGAYRRFGSWQLGLRQQLSATASGSIRPGLVSTWTLDQSQLILAYAWPLSSRWDLIPSLGLGRQSMRIQLQDAYGESLQFTHNGLVGSGQLALAWRFEGRYASSLWVRASHGPANFPRIGSLSGQRLEAGFTASMFLGGVARRIQ